MTNLTLLRIAGFLEGISYLLLFFVTMPLKYYADMKEPNMVVGMAHGFLFLFYVIWVILVKFEKKWNAKTTFLALIASLIPFGTFVADVKLFRTSK